MEQWKPIIGYEGLYEVSDLGNVRSLKRTTTKGKLIKLTPDKDGYLCFTVSKHNTHKTLRVHKEVAKAFVDNPNKYTIINHKDENKQNNRASNLEWCTPQYNATYNGVNYRRGLKKRKPIIAIKDGNEIKFDSITIASEQLNINRGNIIGCLNGYYGRNTAGGYKFKYCENKCGNNYC